MDTPEMTVQAAAALILKKTSHPLSLKELVKTVLKQRLVKSNAADPERSLAGTIDQNINEEREPKLV
ncbi:MAG: HTH domain-containing protein, partial [Dehalococcoidales bacterium]